MKYLNWIYVLKVVNGYINRKMTRNHFLWIKKKTPLFVVGVTIFLITIKFYQRSIKRVYQYRDDNFLVHSDRRVYCLIRSYPTLDSSVSLNRNAMDKGNPPPYAGPPQGGIPGGYGPGYGDPNSGYPPQAGYPPQGGYPPPQGYAGYPPPQAGYPPPQPYFQGGQQMQSSNNIVVVGGGGAPVTNTVIVERQGVNHCLHCIITLFFFPWIIVWIILCITEG